MRVCSSLGSAVGIDFLFISFAVVRTKFANRFDTTTAVHWGCREHQLCTLPVSISSWELTVYRALTNGLPSRGVSVSIPMGEPETINLCIPFVHKGEFVFVVKKAARLLTRWTVFPSSHLFFNHVPRALLSPDTKECQWTLMLRSDWTYKVLRWKGFGLQLQARVFCT